MKKRPDSVAHSRLPAARGRVASIGRACCRCPVVAQHPTEGSPPAASASRERRFTRMIAQR